MKGKKSEAMSKGIVILIIGLMLGAVFLESGLVAAADSQNWILEHIDGGGYAGLKRGEGNSIATGTDNTIHISYYDYDNKDLKYAKWTGSSWSTQTVDSSGTVGEYTSIALDANNRPHIAYWKQKSGNNGDLKYAKWTGSNWNIQTIDINVYGTCIAIAVDNNNRPHISYYDEEDYYLKYAKWTGSSGAIQIVDDTTDAGKGSCIALDSNGHPHISYYDYDNQDLKYAKWTGSNWNLQTVDNSGTVGRYPSIAIDANDYPHISYFRWDTSPDQLKYAKWTGSRWAIQIVDNHNNERFTSITIDSSNYPHISWYRSGCFLMYAGWTGLSWDIQTVDDEHAMGDPSPKSIAIDPNGYIHLSYQRAGPHSGSSLAHAKSTFTVENEPPVISNPTVTPQEGNNGDTFTWSATVTDPEGDVLTVNWSLLGLGDLNGNGYCDLEDVVDIIAIWANESYESLPPLEKRIVDIDCDGDCDLTDTVLATEMWENDGWLSREMDKHAYMSIYTGSRILFDINNDTTTPDYNWTITATDGINPEVSTEVFDGPIVRPPDTTPPSASISINNRATYTNTRSVTLYLTYSDSGSGVDKVRYKNFGESYTSWESPSSTKSWMLRSGTGSRIVYYQVRDKAGNIREVYDSIVLDTTPPPAPSPDDGVTGWSNDNTPTFSWSAPSDTSGVAGYYWKVDSGSEIWTTSTSVTLPAQSDGTHTFHVRAKDNAGNIGNYGSHQFKIDTTNPSVTVNSPNGGEVWYVGTTHYISWTATDNVGATSIDTYYSTNGGSTYPYTVATGETNDGTYTWTIPNTPSTTCKVKVIAYDAAGNSEEDTSDSNFIMPPTPINPTPTPPTPTPTPTVTPTKLMEGDVNLDKCVSLKDSTLIKLNLVGKKTLNEDQLKCADTTDDGPVTLKDSTFIKKWLVDPTTPLWESPADDDMLEPVAC